MKIYLADEELFMVVLAEDDTDYVRRCWFFDSLPEALDYIDWWNELDSSEGPIGHIPEPDVLLEIA